MGFGRDVGAAMTVGLMATTKHKKAEERLQNRFNDHEQRVRSFNVAVERTVDVFQDLSDAFDDAKDACLSTGGLTVNQNDILEYGWFRPTDVAADGSLDEGREVGAAAVGSLPGLGAVIGAPAAAWTLVGVFGTAGTGTAIGTLSGAAATAATAAWLGRLGIAGVAGLGARAAPAVLGGVAFLATLPIQGVIGAAVAGKRERKAVATADTKIAKIHCYNSVLDKFGPEFGTLRTKAHRKAVATVRHASSLSTVVTLTKAGSDESQRAGHQLLEDISECQSLCAELELLVEELQTELGRC